MYETDKGKILMVDDEPNALTVLSAILSHEGYDVLKSDNVDYAIEILHKETVDAIVTDMKMPEKDGLELFQYVSKTLPDIPVIFLTAYGTVDSAVSAMTHGAFYYFIKPPDYVKFKSVLARAVEQRRLRREVEYLRRKLSTMDGGNHIVGNTPQIMQIMKTIEAVKDSASSVLICGETGTGKELVARALHFGSIRRDKPFIAINCAAMPKELIESELFGCEKGAFTGAVARRIGKFEEAAGGTILLDEIGEIDPPLQAKLLRVLQEREIERLGSNKKIKVDFRLLSSTNRDLNKEIGVKFREDLLYRINVVKIEVPPLRERKDDIPLLVDQFLKEFCAREQKRPVGVSEEVMSVLLEHNWPGNVRQLSNVIERAIVLAKGKEITLKDIPEELWKGGQKAKGVSVKRTLKDLEIHAVREALQMCNGNKSLAARNLGISRKAFYKRLKEL
ncbi:MAG TPA: sigma-54 dependent transcriptional regulator [Candidatus Sulfobium mesophilum]|nr:sigma-54 dependent transcriptional regulator [Candidatus Sulfobium mesophilum]